MAPRRTSARLAGRGLGPKEATVAQKVLKGGRRGTGASSASSTKRSVATKKKKTPPATKKAAKKSVAAAANSATVSSGGGGDGSPVEWPHGTLGREEEEKLWARGFRAVAGCDEAGRGPLAGPVVAAACIVPEGVLVEGVNDSKLLSHEERERLYERITKNPAITWAVHEVDNDRIDDINILQAAMEAMSRALGKLRTPADYALIDGNRLPNPLPPHLQRDAPLPVPKEDKKKAAKTKGKAKKAPKGGAPAAHWVIKGDSRCFSIGAASIIAKVHRDRIMMAMHKKYPQYNFAQHKGYPVFAHKQALSKHGPCAIHRLTFRPLKDCYTKDAKGKISRA